MHVATDVKLSHVVSIKTKLTIALPVRDWHEIKIIWVACVAYNEAS